MEVEVVVPKLMIIGIAEQDTLRLLLSRDFDVRIGQHITDDIDILLIDAELHNKLRIERIIPTVVIGDANNRDAATIARPYNPDNVRTFLLFAWRMFSKLRDLQEKFEHRKIVDRAKGVLMDRNRWSEVRAFRAIQIEAMQRRILMAEIARQVIDGRLVLR